jgi:hypothetical protein
VFLERKTVFLADDDGQTKNRKLKKIYIIFLVFRYAGLYTCIYTYCGVFSRYWVTTSKQTTKQHSVLGNRFLISKYSRSLLVEPSQINTFPGKRLKQ